MRAGSRSPPAPAPPASCPRRRSIWQALDLRALIAVFPASAEVLCRAPPRRAPAEGRGGAERLRAAGALRAGALEPRAKSRRRAAHRAAPCRSSKRASAPKACCPPGTSAARRWMRPSAPCARCWQRMAAAQLGAPLPPRALTAAHGGWQVLGTLETLHEQGLPLFHRLGAYPQGPPARVAGASAAQCRRARRDCRAPPSISRPGETRPLRAVPERARAARRLRRDLPRGACAARCRTSPRLRTTSPAAR